MTRVFQHKVNKKVYGLTQIVDNNAYLIDVNTDERRTVTVGTLHRYYQELEQPKEEPKAQTKKSYYKTYKRNEQPLWDAFVTPEEHIVLRDQDKNTVIDIYKTDNCFVVRIANGGKRYFKDIQRVIKHVLHDQDIRTIKCIEPKLITWSK